MAQSVTKFENSDFRKSDSFWIIPFKLHSGRRTSFTGQIVKEIWLIMQNSIVLITLVFLVSGKNKWNN